MKRTFAAVAIVSVFTLSAAAMAQDYAMVPPSEPIKPVSGVLDEVTSRADFGDFKKVAYDRWTHDYKVTYMSRDGSTKVVRIDAVSGQVKKD